MRSAEHLRRREPRWRPAPRRRARERAARGAGGGRRPYRGWRILGRVLQPALLFSLVGALALVGVAIGTGTWQVRPVLSGSMQPGFTIGSVVAVERVPISSLQPRDVVVFHPPGEPGITYVHRIVSLQRSEGVTTIRTRGDDNGAEDPWKVRLEGTSIYKVRFSLPLLGYASVWVRSPAGHRDLLLGGGAFLCVVAASLGLEASRKGRRARQGGARRRGPAGDRPPFGSRGELPPPTPLALPSPPEVSRALELARALETSRALEVARTFQVIQAFGVVRALEHARGSGPAQLPEVTAGAAKGYENGTGAGAGASDRVNPPVGPVTSTEGWVDDRVGYERMI